MNDIESTLDKIRELQATGQHKAVLERYVWRNYSDYPAVLLALSDSYRSLREWIELKQLCTALISHDVESFTPWALFGQAEAEYNLGDLDSSLESVSAMLEIRGDFYWARLLRANIYLDLSDIDRCLVESEFAKSLNNNSNTIYDLYLRIFERTGRITQPLKELSYGQLSVEQVNRISGIFDAEFYSNTVSEINTDVALEHYIDIGWKNGKDPTAEFCTDAYISDYYIEDDQNICPLIHYVYRGQAQGAVTRSSDSQCCSVIVMVKNEADIIKSFSSHVLELFDNVIFVDHQSTDGTREFLDQLSKNECKVKLYDLQEPSYIQALLMNHILRTEESISGSGWVFVLDCDEFLPFKGKADFNDFLAKNISKDILFFRWKNLIPVPYWHDRTISLGREQEYLVPVEYSVHGKVAFKARLLEENQEAWLAQGNHALLNRKDGSPLFHHVVERPLFHLPVRSKNQFSLKLNQGVASYKAIGGKRNKLEGSHWFSIMDKVKKIGLSDNILNRVVSEYGNHREWIEMPIEDLQSAGYRREKLAFSAQPLSQHVESKLGYHELMLGVSIEDRMTADFSGPVSKLQTTGNNEIFRATTADEILVKASDKRNELQCLTHLSDEDYLYEFLKPSYWDIELLTPTAWSGHIPFLFCLVSMIRPKSYAELGTHFGASFFAYCQACERREIPTIPVAIDCWEGDDHTGTYEESVFTQFRHNVTKYDGLAKYLRMYFDEAVEYFEDGSLDLLHIDGLHTYEAVKHDFETWLGKMSNRGIVMFHDTNVHEREFGVWQYWREIKEKYPTIEFKHSHGLGVAYVGNDNNPDILRLFQVLNMESKKPFIQHHLESISQTKSKNALNRYEIDELRSTESLYYALCDESTLLKQKINSLRCERDNLSELAKINLNGIYPELDLAV